MRCIACHYSLANLTEHRCPECGREFDPDDPSTYKKTPRTPLYIMLICGLSPLTIAAWVVLSMIFNTRETDGLFVPTLILALVVQFLLLGTAEVLLKRHSRKS